MIGLLPRDYGGLCGCPCVPLDTSGSATAEVTKTDGSETAKIFVWDGDMKPVTNAAEIGL